LDFLDFFDFFDFPPVVFGRVGLFGVIKFWKNPNTPPEPVDEFDTDDIELEFELPGDDAGEENIENQLPLDVFPLLPSDEIED
jgi:hypothetical protein